MSVDNPMTPTRLLAALQAERARWDALLAEVGEARMTQAGVEGEWSVKDIIAHVTWFEREMVGLLQAHALVGSELWNLAQDERNAAIYEQNRGRPLSDVLAEARLVFEQLAAAAQSLSDEDLTDPLRFAGMPGDWTPWRILAGNSFEHYGQHAPSIRDWLDQHAA
jgi:hypothetical protein